MPRGRPLELLNAGERCTLTLVDAPAGSGKTTALGQWLAGFPDGRAGCWFSVDRSDNDPTRFWSYVIIAIREAIPGFGESPHAALRASADVPRFVLPGMINEIARAGARLALVVDDYHLITNAAIHSQLEQLLERLPGHVQVVLSTRVDPPLPLSRWRGRGQLAEIREADLRFTSSEARDMFARMEVALAREDVDRLVERTEGWAAGLSLAGLSMAAGEDSAEFVRAFGGTERHVLEYLTAEVLGRQSPEAQRFLVRVSVLGRLSGALCDFVLKRRGSKRLLEELEQSNAFLLSLGRTREWYRLHHLFAEALQSELRRDSADLIPLLHRRASRWHAAEGVTFEAIEHAVEARAPGLVADQLLPAIFAYLGGGQADTVVGWLRRLGEDAVMSEPRLCLIAGTVSLVRGDAPEMERWLALAESGSYDGPLPTGPASIAAGVATIRGVVTSGRLSAHLEAARSAVDLSRDDTSLWRVLAAAGLGSALYWTGEFEEARPWLETAARSGPPLLSSTAYGGLGMIAVDLGDPAAAERHAADGQRIGEEHKLLTSPPFGRVLLARGRAGWRHGRSSAAASALEQAVEVLRPGPYPLELADALLALSQVRHASGAEHSARGAMLEARNIIAGLEERGILADRLEATERRLADRSTDIPAPTVIDELSSRERDVLLMLPSALSEAEIANELFVSYHTVHSHIRAIYRKLGTSSRAQTIEKARAIGLLPNPLVPTTSRDAGDLHRPRTSD